MTCAPTLLHSKVESAVAAKAILAVFLGSVERRFFVPADIVPAIACSLGQGWPQAIGEADAKRP